MLHEALANATDISLWAQRNQATDYLPMLIRRLIVATAVELDRVDMPAGEGVYSGDWDGLVCTGQNSLFVPAGLSAWEMGKEANPKGKADADYLKRAADPGDIEPASTTFIFVTPRRWSQKRKWAVARNKERTWKKVLAYDAEDLAMWLETAASVHIWFSLLLGKRTLGAEDLEQYWRGWSEVTRPITPPEMLLSGRESASGEVLRWIASGPSPLGLRADSRDEATAFFGALVHSMAVEPRANILARAVVTETTEAMQHFSTVGKGLILIAQRVEPRLISDAIRAENHVFVPLGRNDPSVGRTVDLPRLRRDPVHRALVEQGLAWGPAADAATLARRSLTAFRRKFSNIPDFRCPLWAEVQHYRAVFPALLAEKWNENVEGDRAIISRLAGVPYEQVANALAVWAESPDAPVRRNGSVWFLSSKEDAWHLTGKYLTAHDLKTFTEICGEVFSRPEPVWNLEPDRRYMAGILGATSDYSPILKEGLADSLALLAVRGEGLRIGLPSGFDLVDSVIKKVLSAANTDWRIWASLSHYLPLLAEAAPDAFLSLLEIGIPVVVPLFAPQGNPLFSPTPHTGILWALENLAWNQDLLGQVSKLLAILSRLDPGIKSNQANRPLNSLRTIFLCWSPQTQASIEHRLRVLDMLRELEPSVAWKLLQSFIAQPQSVSHPSHQPKWRDWSPESIPNISRGELERSANEATTRYLADVGSNAERWGDVLEDFPNLSASDRSRIVDHLAGLDYKTLPQSDAARLRDDLRQLVSRHREFADANWSLPEIEMNALEAVSDAVLITDPLGKHEWLFSHYPHLPDVRSHDNYDARDEAIASRRREALADVYAGGGLSLLVDLADRSEATWSIGEITCKSSLLSEDESIALIQSCLNSEHPRRRFLGHAFIITSFEKQGWIWADGWLQNAALLGNDPDRRAAFYCSLPRLTVTWDRLESEDKEVQEAYWRDWAVTRIEERHEYERVVRTLLRFSEPLAALSLLHKREPAMPMPVPSALAIEALEQASRSSLDHWNKHHDAIHDVAELLDDLDEMDDVSDKDLAMLEWQFVALLEQRRRPARLYRLLASDAALFVDLLCLIFKPRHEEPDEPNEERKALARNADRLLNHWQVIPGTQKDGSVSSKDLSSWVEQVRALAFQNDRIEVTDIYIGHVLAHSLEDDDGAWPLIAIRDLIEAVASPDLESGIETQVANKRGPTWRSPTDGGDQERDLVGRYSGYAQSVSVQWHRTSAMLRRMALSYESEAKWADMNAELREDMWR